MNCCEANHYDDAFNLKMAVAELDKYRKKGPRRETRLLLDALNAEGIQGATVLDIGGGVGAVHHELLAVGASHATDVDASRPYLNASRQEAQRRGHTDHIDYRYGDFAALAPEIDPADIVTLDRVICCYPDMEALVRLSSERARRLYGIVIPRDGWLMGAASQIINLGLRVVRFPLPIYIHSAQTIDTLVRANGFAPRYSRKTLLWQVLVYTRAGG